MKINIDGSWIEGRSGGGTGMILRDEEGVIIFSSIMVESDCLEVIYP